MIPAERHNEYKIHLKALHEQILVVFLQIEIRAAPGKSSSIHIQLLGHVGHVCHFDQSCFRTMKFPVCRLEHWILK